VSWNCQVPLHQSRGPKCQLTYLFLWNPACNRIPLPAFLTQGDPKASHSAFLVEGGPCFILCPYRG
jgi:hypothetical protein